MRACRAKAVSDSGIERCERKAGHKGPHSYTCNWHGKKWASKFLWQQRPLHREAAK